MQIFLSHAGLDAELAQFVEQQLCLGDESLRVFRTSRVGQIPAGKEWLSYIQSHIRQSDRFLILLTPWSMARPWINFETGAAWYSERKMIPVVAGGLDKNDVVEPLRSFQILSLERPNEAEQAFTELGSRLGDPVQFCSAVMSLSAKARMHALASNDWEGVDFEGDFYAWEGAFEELAEGQPKPIPKGLHNVLEAAGRQLRAGVFGDLLNENSKGYSLVYLVDMKRRRKHPLVGDDRQVLLSKSRDRPAGA